MNITVLAVGTKMPRWVDEAVGEYAKRFGRDVNYALKEIKPEKRGAGVNAAQGMAAEEKRLLEAIPQGAFLVVLDERGKAPTSVELAQHLKSWQQNGEHVCFIIGGADGMTDRLKQQANMMMRLSSLTLPHGMVRVLLTEQLYRAVSIAGIRRQCRLVGLKGNRASRLKAGRTRFSDSLIFPHESFIIVSLINQHLSGEPKCPISVKTSSNSLWHKTC